MNSCYQHESQTIYQHGLSVKEHLFLLIKFLRQEIELPGWKLPSWLSEYRGFILKNLFFVNILEQYTIFHDCGKPFCREVDEQGKQHFPDHAAISKQIWLQYGGSQEIADLIEMDMEIHQLKSEQLEEFAHRPQAISLLLTGLAEIHANASMFGGIESVSFKIKYKHLEKRGRQIFKILERDMLIK